MEENTLNEAAEKLEESAIQYADWNDDLGIDESCKKAFIDGAKSNAAKEYWQSQLQSQQNKDLKSLEENTDIDTIGKCANCGVEFHIHKSQLQQPNMKSVSEREIEKLAEKEYPTNQNIALMGWKDAHESLEKTKQKRKIWIAGFKAALTQSSEGAKWVKASELKEIDYPLCIKLDGGGAPFYTTVCSMGELLNLTSEMNPIDKIYYLNESNYINQTSNE